MTITYRQLTLDQRYQIQALLTAGHTQSEIARQLGSSISRELKRAPGGCYKAKQAQKQCDYRRCNAYKATKFYAEHWYVLRQYWSPEMIANR